MVVLLRVKYLCHTTVTLSGAKREKTPLRFRQFVTILNSQLRVSSSDAFYYYVKGLTATIYRRPHTEVLWKS